MGMLKSLALVIFVFILGSSIFAQSKVITHDEFYSVIRSHYDKEKPFNQRHISKTEVYKEGKVSSKEEWLYEYVRPDKIHYRHTEVNNGKTQITEEIDIGKSIYCKRNEGAWEEVKGSCIGGSTGGVPNIVSSKYSVEKTKLDGHSVNLYREYITFKDTFSVNKDKEGLSFDENKYWLDSLGRFARKEVSYGLIDPHRLDRLTVDTYEYDQKIKIEPPIK